MTTGGFSTPRLERLRAGMREHVYERGVPGALTMLWRRGELIFNSYGVKSLGDTDPIRRDAIFRITSMTKPLTAAAAMLLIEECKLRLDDPIDPWLPELADRRVLRKIDGPIEDTVPAARAITVRDLLTFRMGFGIVMAPPGTYPIQQAADALGLGTLGPPSPAIEHTPDEWMSRLGTLPLMAQPGERWLYNTPAAVLGVLISRVSGQSLETFMRERLFEPLGMRDTGFSVPGRKIDRLVGCYAPSPDGQPPALFDGVTDSQWSHPAVFPDAAAGLVSTIDDYLAFALMMLNNGRHNRERILSRSSIATMTTDQITLQQKASSPFAPGFWDNRGWGLGLSMYTRRNDIASAPGRYGWDGGYGTSWWNDPQEEMVGLLMTQQLWTSPSPPPVCHDFWSLAYCALEE
jgi:CubicO group peptidase (beta-lactamase class C family)